MLQKLERNIKCNKCGFVGSESAFRHGHDFFQNDYIAGCPKCDNSQNPGDASMRMFGGARPFEYADEAPVPVTSQLSALAETLRRANGPS